MHHQTRWAVEKIAARLALIAPLVHRRRAALEPWRFQALPGPETPPPVDPALDDSDWPTISAGEVWGEGVADFVQRSRFTVPARWASEGPVALHLPLGDAESFSHPEALVYIDGEPFAACDRHHEEVLLPKRWCDGQPHTLALHGWTGLSAAWDGTRLAPLVMRDCAVVQIDSDTRDFIALARVALGAVRSLDEDAPARSALLNALDAAFRILDTREPLGDAFYESVSEARARLQAGIEGSGGPLPVHVTATGHAHIDVAWLWTLGQTRQKAGRTFHNMLRLMEQFPEFRFTQSQPQLYEYVRQDFPELFEGIRARVAEGRWEPIGGMWVEADCNLSGAESLARQFLLGRSFFQEHFGPDAESSVLWLPDVFGYAWALPQLIQQAGLEYFFTIKIGWNQYNRLPYDSFWWQGIDGTRVLTHFSTTTENEGATASTYNAQATPEEVQRTWRHFQQKAEQQLLLMAFGYGDGGGGPTREMLENLERLRAFPSLPQVQQRPVEAFFREMETASGERLPLWNGELYLEYHRGTYTTQARNKRANRRCEFLLHDAEFLAAMAAQEAEHDYPHEALTRAWRLLCLNQFHDIIPGTSIHEVYVGSQRDYEEIEALAVQLRDAALDALGAPVGTEWLLANPTGVTRNDLALLPGALLDGEEAILVEGRAVPHQVTAEGLLVEAGPLLPYSFTPLHTGQAEPARRARALVAEPNRLENDFLRVELNEAGDIVRLYDKEAARELLPERAIANQFQAFEDRPMRWDAWDIDIFYDDRHWLAEPARAVRVVAAGPLRATIKIERQILNSHYTQRISLDHHSPRLAIETQIDWRERHILLKVAFPVEILSPVATYEIQWGQVQRPTHRNTSWDWARFESCAQKWVDLSEGDYGVSLLNDCKYGHDIRDNVMRISLLRSPTWPDPEADQGEHRFAVALLPHAGPVGSETVAAAYELNDPIIVHPVRDGAAELASSPSTAFVACDAPNVVIETIKQAEDGRGIIVRLYESQRQRGEVTLRTSFPLTEAHHTNLLEETERELPVAGNQLRLRLRPFEIVTLRLVGGARLNHRRSRDYQTRSTPY